jgi:hypothetical protein
MSIRTISTVFAALLICSMADASAQAVFKEVDDEGNTTFTDRPPARRAIAPRRGGKVDMKEAARRLEQARLQRRLGAQPGPGELSQGHGAPTANYRYWQRQEKLRLAVEQALRRSQETQRQQLASR